MHRNAFCGRVPPIDSPGSWELERSSRRSLSRSQRAGDGKREGREAKGKERRRGKREKEGKGEVNGNWPPPTAGGYMLLISAIVLLCYIDFVFA